MSNDKTISLVNDDLRSIQRSIFESIIYPKPRSVIKSNENGLLSGEQVNTFNNTLNSQNMNEASQSFHLRSNIQEKKVSSALRSQQLSQPKDQYHNRTNVQSQFELYNNNSHKSITFRENSNQSLISRDGKQPVKSMYRNKHTNINF